MSFDISEYNRKVDSKVDMFLRKTKREVVCSIKEGMESGRFHAGTGNGMSLSTLKAMQEVTEPQSKLLTSTDFTKG